MVNDYSINNSLAIKSKDEKKVTRATQNLRASQDLGRNISFLVSLNSPLMFSLDGSVGRGICTSMCISRLDRGSP